MLADPRLNFSPHNGHFPVRPDLGEDLPVRFYLGAPHAHWLRHSRGVPLFVSHITLKKCAGRIPRPRGPWALDSGGFTEISRHGRFTTSARDYATAIARYHEQSYGTLVFASPQDMMCEPEQLGHGGILPSGERAHGTGLTLREHQQRTVASVLELREMLEPYGISSIVAPVLQGWEPEQYEQNLADYYDAGIEMAAEPTVGIGSVCRRAEDDGIVELVSSLHARGLRLHGFGVKTAGLGRLTSKLLSADSMAWSLAARMAPSPISRDCDHRRCVCCPRYAMTWRQRLLDQLRADQPDPARPIALRA